MVNISIYQWTDKTKDVLFIQIFYWVQIIYISTIFGCFVRVTVDTHVKDKFKDKLENN